MFNFFQIHLVLQVNLFCVVNLWSLTKISAWQCYYNFHKYQTLVWSWTFWSEKVNKSTGVFWTSTSLSSIASVVLQNINYKLNIRSPQSHICRLHCLWCLLFTKTTTNVTSNNSVNSTTSHDLGINVSATIDKLGLVVESIFI